MHLLTLLAASFVLGTVAALDPFLNCPGNFPKWYNFKRRCCENEPQLYENCECFSVESASGFTNSALMKPKCPEDLNVRFLLYTEYNKDTFQLIKAGDSSIANSHFRSGKPVIIISHGFKDQAEKWWSVAMKNGFLNENDGTKDANVILVDWRDGAKGSTLYYGAVANLRAVGAMVAKLVTTLVDSHGADYATVHLIGHSLGAHLSAMAGKEVLRYTGTKVGRISGLDPAGPAFEGNSDLVRLTPNDAVFVDVIHTDAEPLTSSGFGIRLECGHVDFWPNGGTHQPACGGKDNLATLLDLTDLNGSIEDGACSHMIGLDYYIYSINETCAYQTGGGCRMGYHASKASCTGHVDLNVAAAPPYCKVN